MKPIIPDYSSMVNEVRRQLAISQEDLARELDVSYATVIVWKKGRPSRPMNKGVSTANAKRKGHRKQEDPLERAIEEALDPGRFISYREAWDFLEVLQKVADNIQEVIGKEPERATHLFEIFIAACHEKAAEIGNCPDNHPSTYLIFAN